MAIVTAQFNSQQATLVVQTDVSTLPSVEAVGFQISGNWTGTITFQATIDGNNYFNVNAVPLNVSTLPASQQVAVSSTTANGAWAVPIFGYSFVRAIGVITAGQAGVASDVTQTPLIYSPVFTAMINSLIDVDTQLRITNYLLAQIQTGADIPKNLSDPTIAIVP